jgi:hypothetical protein
MALEVAELPALPRPAIAPGDPVFPAFTVTRLPMVEERTYVPDDISPI